jgi:hypothetical protein
MQIFVDTGELISQAPDARSVLGFTLVLLAGYFNQAVSDGFQPLAPLFTEARLECGKPIH